MDNPEHITNLWIRGVLNRAYKDAIGSNKDDGEYKEEAVEWFQSDRTEVGSFMWICYSLGFEPDSLREKIMDRIRRKAHETERLPELYNEV